MAVKKKGGELAKMLKQSWKYTPQEILNELDKPGAAEILKTLKISKFLRFGNTREVYDKVQELLRQ